MSALFSPFTMRGLTVPNRIVISPMCQYSSDDGSATAWHMMHLGSLSLSGAAILTLEATAVEPDGRITREDLGLFDDATEHALAPVIAAIRNHSNIAISVQLAHAGRKASTAVPWKGGAQLSPGAVGGWQTVSASDLPYSDKDRPPVALDARGLARVRDAYATAAKRADRLGLDAIEIHGAHGYLLHQFMSPLSNKRTDEYGGSLANRIRFPLEVFDAVRAAFSADKPVGMRVSASDWVDGGWDLPQTLELATELKARGIDWIDASSGGMSPAQKIPLGPGYQVPFAAAIRELGINTFAVGLITEPKQADEIIASGKADFVALARAMLYDARWPWHAAAELGATVDAPPQYWRAPPREYAGIFGKH
jgi:2,4-dienoyl-CoA reductase-like NADH-dependent reductase (Old Yellow Enzyme family)